MPDVFNVEVREEVVRDMISRGMAVPNQDGTWELNSEGMKLLRKLLKQRPEILGQVTPAQVH